MPYNFEVSEIPSLVAIRPTYDSASSAAAITAVPAMFNYGKRLKNDSSPFDSRTDDTKSFTVDIYDNVKQVTVGGIGTFTYRQVSRLIKGIGDAERALLP
jgi:hypothetical protein